MGLLARIKSGGYVNTLIPVHAGLVVAMSLGIVVWLAPARAAGAAGRGSLRVLGLVGVLALQLLGLAYDPRNALPEPDAAVQNAAFLHKLAKVEGEVLSDQRFVQTQVGLASR